MTRQDDPNEIKRQLADTMRGLVEPVLQAQQSAQRAKELIALAELLRKRTSGRRPDLVLTCPKHAAAYQVYVLADGNVIGMTGDNSRIARGTSVEYLPDLIPLNDPETSFICACRCCNTVPETTAGRIRQLLNDGQRRAPIMMR